MNAKVFLQYRSGRNYSLWLSLFAGFHGCNSLCFLPTGNSGCQNTIGQTGSGRSHTDKTKTHSDTKHTFQSRITGCSTDFRNKQVCELNMFPEYLQMYYGVLCFSTVKKYNTCKIISKLPFWVKIRKIKPQLWDINSQLIDIQVPFQELKLLLYTDSVQ